MSEEMKEIYNKLDKKSQEVMLLLARGMLLAQSKEE